MHGGYRRTFGPESVIELSKNIIVQHEDYLKQDDPDKKADALRYMAGYAVQYLHLVPHEKKFTFKETERVLHSSAMNIAEFDPREGYLAFGSLAKYAENLLEQPWRKDFHIIKLTSGFYVHNIAAQLQNAHEILIVMGYVNLDDTTLKLLPTPINYSALKAVSRDCYIASQECLILSQIWQHVADQEPDYPLTIGEVFEYRKNHLGDTDTICQKLMYDIRVRMHETKQQKQQQLLLLQKHQSSNLLKNAQRFVPVDRLIDYDGDELSMDEPDATMRNFIPEREVERSQEMLKNVNLYNYADTYDEHIYDPVYGSTNDVPPALPTNHQRVPSHTNGQQQKLGNNDQFFYNNNSRKSVPAQLPAVPIYNPYQQQQYPNPNNFNSPNSSVMNMYVDQRNSMSPMIPKTITSMFPSNNVSNGIQPSGSRNSVSKSNSMNSISGTRISLGSSSSSSSFAQNYPNTPLLRTKVKETDLDAETGPSSNVRDVQCYNSKMNNDNGRKIRKSLPASVAVAQNNHNSNQVYPDEFYPPGIVKPVAVYGSLTRNYPRNEELSSLDTVYYDYLLKQGQTDEIMGNHRSSSEEHNPEPRRTGTSSSSSSHLPSTRNSSSEVDESHLYDGRRVVSKKKLQHQNFDQNLAPKRVENEPRRRIPVESVIPGSKNDPNYNNLLNSKEMSKPHHEKNMRKSNIAIAHSSSASSMSADERKFPLESDLPQSPSPPLASPPHPPNKEIEPWDCRFCTFKNMREDRICEVCAKSKDFFEELEVTPTNAGNGGRSSTQPREPDRLTTPKLYSTLNHTLSSGIPNTAVTPPESPQERPCPQCTLLNPVRARVCDACNFRLKPLQSPGLEEGEREFDNR